FFFQAEDGIRDFHVTGVQTCALPILSAPGIENPMTTWVRMRDDTPELYFSDARGLIVQLSGDDYCGGTGPLGASCAAPEAVAPRSEERRVGEKRRYRLQPVLSGESN